MSPEDVTIPRMIAFELTRRCRFDCRHCRADASAKADRMDLSTHQCKQILLSIANYSRCILIATGGEPMERPDIYELITYGREQGLRMVMASCGYLVNDESIGRLKDSGIQALSFSIDGASADTHDLFRRSPGAFDAAINATKVARQAGVPFQINTTVSKINVQEIIAIAELVQRLGATCFNPFILVPTGRGEHLADQLLDPIQYETLLNELLRIKLASPIEVRVTCGPQFARVASQSKAEKRVGAVPGCMGGREFGFVSCLGDVQTCGFLDLAAGNLIQNGFDFARIWQHSPLLNAVRDRRTFTGQCHLCKYLDQCGGCRARAFAACGDVLASDPICRVGPQRPDTSDA